MSKRRARIGLERPVRPAIPWLEHRPGRLPGGQFAARSDEHLLPCGWRRRKHKDGRPPESSRTARWRVQATCLAHKFSELDRARTPGPGVADRRPAARAAIRSDPESNSEERRWGTEW